MDLELAGRVVLVTGGSDGLGRALCHRLVGEGASVGLCGRRAEPVDDTVDRLRRAGGDVLGLAADVTRPEDLARFVDAAVSRWGRIDAVCNNAGASAAKPFDRLDDADVEDDLALKLLGAIRLTRLALPHLRASKGAVVNTLAIAAKAPGPASVPTSVSRAAGLALTKALSHDLAPDGIRVNAVLVGFVESGQWERRAAAQGRSVPDFYEELARSMGIPLGRIGRAEEFADLVAYLISSRASYVTGTAVNLDGGICPVV